MIVVTVELHSAVNGKRSVLGTVVIDNVTDIAKHVEHEGRRGDYRVRGYKKDEDYRIAMLAKNKPLREGRVENHPSISKPIWNLVHKALTSLGYAK